MSHTCTVRGCSQEATYDIPAPLCGDHWQQWFNDWEADPDESLKRILAGIPSIYDTLES